MRRALFSLQYRYLSSRWYYPKAVREAFNTIISHPERSEGSLANARNPTFVGDSSVAALLQNDKHSGRLKLATGFLDYDGMPNWRQQFDDPEQTMSLHRWGWLIYGDVEKNVGIALMRSWISAMGLVPNGIAGTPYTTSERIINALLFLSHGEGIPEDLHAALLKMAYHVARHLEYHGTRGTGNHVVNNARALFFAGQVFHVRELSDLALVIIKDALQWLITKDGFLREESSHYHLLFTRWIVEVYELAKNTGHQEMESYLNQWVKQLVQQCWFFLVEDTETGEWQMPLIGDVSPDCTPEWLVTYLMPFSESYKPNEWSAQGIKAFSESGWFRFDRKPLTIFWHIPQANMIHRATHGHADACSFVLFHNGRLMIVDPGRATYQSDRGCLAEDHNSLTIDGLDPFFYDRAQKFPVFYQNRNVRCDWKQEGEQFVFSIFHIGFHRIRGDKINHVRRFRLSERLVTVEDELRGRHTHTIETFFHFAPSADKMNLQHSQGERDTHVVWTSHSYGVTIPSTSIMVQSKVQLPAKFNYCLQLP